MREEEEEEEEKGDVPEAPLTLLNFPREKELRAERVPFLETPAAASEIFSYPILYGDDKRGRANSIWGIQGRGALFETLHDDGAKSGIFRRPILEVNLTWSV